MRIVIDISKDRYDEIMSMDWKNGRLIFDEEIIAIHDGKAIEQEPCEDCISRQAALDEISKSVDHSLYAYKSLMECVKTLPPATQQEPKADDDCISRQAVLDELDKHKYSNEFCEEHHIDWSINLGMAHIVIKELPPGNLQEPKTNILDEIKKIAAKWEEDTWTDNLSYECMVQIAGLVAEVR